MPRGLVEALAAGMRGYQLRPNLVSYNMALICGTWRNAVELMGSMVSAPKLLAWPTLESRLRPISITIYSLHGSYEHDVCMLWSRLIYTRLILGHTHTG